MSSTERGLADHSDSSIFCTDSGKNPALGAVGLFATLFAIRSGSSRFNYHKREPAPGLGRYINHMHHAPPPTAHANSPGYTIVRGVVSPGEVAALLSAAMEQVAAGPVPGLYDEHHIMAADEPLARWPRMLQPHRFTDLTIGRLVHQLMLDERLLSPVRNLMGGEPLAAQSMMYFKPPGARGQDLHQDDFYLRSAPTPCMAAWIALDPADSENGGLNVVPGSQHCALLPVRATDKKRFFAEDAVDVPPGMTAVPTTLAPGDVLFFDGRVIHGSGPNTSTTRFRRSCICHYVVRGTTELNPWNNPVLSRDGQASVVPEAPVGPWRDGSFAKN